MNPGGGGCGEPRSHHCTPAWVTRVKLRLKEKKDRKKVRKERENGQKEEKKEAERRREKNLKSW